jgi:hypothetical protein
VREVEEEDQSKIRADQSKIRTRAIARSRKIKVALGSHRPVRGPVSCDADFTQADNPSSSYLGPQLERVCSVVEFPAPPSLKAVDAPVLLQPEEGCRPRYRHGAAAVAGYFGRTIVGVPAGSGRAGKEPPGAPASASHVPSQTSNGRAWPIRSRQRQQANSPISSGERQSPAAQEAALALRAALCPRS